MAYIEVRHSAKRYGSGEQEIIANQDVTFDILKRGVGHHFRVFWGGKIHPAQYLGWYGYQ